MNQKRRRYRWALLAFMILLFLFLGAMDVFVVTSQRRAQFDHVKSYIRSEMALAGTFMSEAMLREEFSIVEQFVLRWGERDKEIIEFKAITPTGINLAHFARERQTNSPIQVTYKVEFEGQHLLNLVMIKDLSGFDRTFAKLRRTLLQRSFVLIILLGLISWLILKNLALRPLEQEIDKRLKIEKELERTRDDLEIRVHKRTAELLETNIRLEKEVEERHKTAKELYEAKEEWERTFNAIGDLVTIQDVDMNIIKVNKAMCEEFNLPPEELIGKRCYDLFHDLKEPCEGCLDVLCDKTSRSDLLEIFHPKLNKTLMVSRASIYDEDDEFIGAVHIARDITKQKQLEDQLLRSQKMEAVGTLAGGIAHDFNNILAAILGFSDLALLVVNDEAKLKEYLFSIKKSGKRARDLVAQILAFSRQTHVEKEIINVAPLVKESLKLLQSVLPSTIEIKQNIESSAGTIMADPTQIHQIVMNLCTNASHAMEADGGILNVELYREEVHHRRMVDHQKLEQGWYVKLMVSDTGHGIDEAVQDRIFEPFFTTKEKTEGTGMGLAVVHGIIEEYGGAIGMQSTLGKGTCFELFFPLVEGDSVQKESGIVPDLKKGDGHILFVDDEDDLVEMGEKILTFLGYTVTSYTSSTDALEFFRAQAGSIDLVITDQTMPGMTGVEFAKRLLEIRKGIPIILCTGYSTVVSEETAKEAGVREFLLKPLSIHQLSDTVYKVLQKKSHQ
jgi:two-component system, cell cycle sensor histidine kinase and response regulator CckA